MLKSKPNVPFLLFVNLLGLVSITKGLECLSCAHNVGQSIPPPPAAENYHESCKKGRVPIDKFITNCVEGDVCGMVYYEGKLPRDVPHGQLTRRGCMNWKTEGCRVYKASDLFGDAYNLPIMVAGVLYTIYPFEDDATLEICTCNGDQCKFGDEGDNNCEHNGCNSSSKWALNRFLFHTSMITIFVTIIYFKI